MRLSFQSQFGWFTLSSGGRTKDLVRKTYFGILSTTLPVLKFNLQSTDRGRPDQGPYTVHLITRNLRQNGGRPDSTQNFRSLKMASDRYREMYGEN